MLERLSLNRVFCNSCGRVAQLDAEGRLVRSGATNHTALDVCGNEIDGP